MKEIYLLFIIITGPNGGYQELNSGKVLFTQKACKENAILISKAILSKMPKVKVKTKCIPHDKIRM